MKHSVFKINTDYLDKHGSYTNLSGTNQLHISFTQWQKLKKVEVSKPHILIFHASIFLMITELVSTL